MDGGAWWATVHAVAKNRTRLSDFTFTFHFPALEKAMATHSSVLAWRIPGMGEPGGLPSMGSQSRTRLKWLSSSSSSSMLIISAKPGRKFEKVYYQLCFLKDGRLLCLFLNGTPLKACKRKVIALILSEEKQGNWGQREGDLHCRLRYRVTKTSHSAT